MEMTMKKIFIIAEAGVNHNGSTEIAKKLVDVAVKAGADAVKFQTFQVKNLLCEKTKKPEYQVRMTGGEETQYEMLRKLELSHEAHFELLDYCKTKGILFLSTPFDIESIEFLDRLGINILKIPSGEITNYPYLKRIGEKKKDVILSTGMSQMEEVKEAVRVLKENGAKEVTILHCNTEYPTPMKDVNLLAMKTMEKELQLPVGYSDHTEGIEAAIGAAALGAAVIEKHFTLDKNMEGPDHKASLEPDELKEMVCSIRNIELALGDGKKITSESEKKNIEFVRKSIVASKKIEKGEAFSEDNITTKRPGYGVSPMRWNEVIGTKSDRDYEIDDMIML